MKDYYEILGVPKNASKEAIKQAYRKLAHQHHPDRGGEEKKFKEINEAYQVLGDEHKKTQYDQFGSSFGSQDFSGSPDFQGFSAQGGPASGWDFNDIFSDFFGGNTRTTGRTKRSVGQDIKVDISISLEEAFLGVTKTLSLRKYLICDSCKGARNEPGSGFKTCGGCGGSGEIRRNQRIFFGTFTQVSGCDACGGAGRLPEKKCSKCRGLGRIQAGEEIVINIPAGVHTGMAIKAPSKGEAGEGGYGDLYAYIHVKAHPLFERDRDNIFSEISISMSQAALGDTVTVKTLAGDENIKIPCGIESGEMVKLTGKGMPRLESAGRGDQYVKIIVRTPKKLSKKTKELFEALKTEGV